MQRFWSLLTRQPISTNRVMSTMTTHFLHHPYCLFVTHVVACDTATGVDKFDFQLPLFPHASMFSKEQQQPLREGRVFACQRPANQSLDQLFDRLSSNINSYFGTVKRAGNTRPLKATRMQLIIGGVPLEPTMTLNKAFSVEDEMKVSNPQLYIELEMEKQETNMEDVVLLYIDVCIRPAIVRKLSLDLLPQVGCPFIPSLDAINVCPTQSKFHWFVSQSPMRELIDADWPTIPTSTNYVFTPKPEHVGRFVRLKVMPFDASGRPGMPYGAYETRPTIPIVEGSSPSTFLGQFIECKKRVVHAPKQELHQTRYRETEKPANAENGEFRLVSYNLLALMYSSTESARTLFFRHCPPRYLEPEYRFPLLFREILKYQSDILCLQEVDTSNFHRYLAPLLKHESGFEGIHMPKLMIDVPDNITALPPPRDTSYPYKAEGPAIFYNTNRFRLVQKFEVKSLMMAAENFDDLSANLELLTTELPIWYCLRARAQGMVVCLFEETVGKSKGSRLLVACTHLYFQPIAIKLRQIQCATVRRIVLKLAMDHAVEVDGKKIPLPIFIGADLNTQPGSSPFNYLVSELGDAAESQRVDEKSAIIFQSAYDLSPETTFTNITPGFKGILDSILYTTNSMPAWSVKQTLAVPTETEILDAGRRALAEDASLEKPVCPESEGGLTLPNSQFPSDHLALVVDFVHSKSRSISSPFNLNFDPSRSENANTLIKCADSHPLKASQDPGNPTTATLTSASDLFC